jgi:hypothetical protein
VADDLVHDVPRNVRVKCSENVIKEDDVTATVDGSRKPDPRTLAAAERHAWRES